ncbi:MAG: NAD(P)H-binding protein [Vicinamibacterales bacterium]
MKIAIVGATGRTGSRVVAEALSRGHTVTAIMRDARKLAAPQSVAIAQLDVLDTAALTAAFHGMHAIVHALNPNDQESAQMRAANQRAATLSIIEAAKASGTRRLLAVGGAGTLKRDGMRFMDHPEFPVEWRGGALATSVVNELLYPERELEWTILSPSHWFRPGERTGTFRVGRDDLLIDATGESRISMEDYAVALVDEIERPKHIRQRFTVGY